MSDKKNKIDYDLLRELAALVRDAELGEIELEHDGLRIRMARPAPIVTQVAAAPVPMPVSPAPVTAEPAVSMPGAAAPAADDAPPPPGTVRSPMVGTAYLSPEPGADPFVKVGDQVREGQSVLIVEAMKTMNQIPAPKSGTVTEILVEDGQPVEYGEALIVIS